jgi:hypothetical protein
MDPSDYDWLQNWDASDNDFAVADDGCSLVDIDAAVDADGPSDRR